MQFGKTQLETTDSTLPHAAFRTPQFCSNFLVYIDEHTKHQIFFPSNGQGSLCLMSNFSCLMATVMNFKFIKCMKFLDKLRI